mgnify:CR=1 FL=1
MSLTHFGTYWDYNNEKNAFELHRHDYSIDNVIASITADEVGYWCTFNEPIVADYVDWKLLATNVTSAQEEVERLLVMFAQDRIKALGLWIKTFKGE